MRSIKGRLLRAFLIIIAVFGVATLVLFFVNLRVVQQYKAISDVMIAEYRLVENASTLIDAFNVYLQSAGTDARDSESKIEVAEAEIQSLTLFLDTNIQDTQSKSNYIGFKSSVTELTLQINQSLKRFKEEGIKDYFSDYNQVNKQYGFVRDNGSVLIYGQLKYSSSIRDAINTTYSITVIFGLITLLVIIVGCILFVLQFAKHFTKPLSSLTLASKAFAGGDMNVNLDQSILLQTDEIGTLAQSFNSMEIALRDKILELNKSNTEIARSAESVANKNDELNRLNSFMVNRELKMVALKKEITDLKKRLGE